MSGMECGLVCSRDMDISKTDMKRIEAFEMWIWRKMEKISWTPFDSLHMVFYYRPIVTLCLQCTVFEIGRHIGRKSPKKTHPPSFGTFFGDDSLRIFRRLIPSQKLESWGYQMVYISRSCFRSAMHNTGVWQTDGQTDRQTDGQTRRCRKDPR